MTKDRIGHYQNVEVVTAPSTQSSDDSRSLQQLCSPVACDSWDSLPLCDDAAQVSSDLYASPRRFSHDRTPYARLRLLGETVTHPRPSHSPNPTGSEIEQASDVEQGVDVSTWALPPTSEVEESVDFGLAEDSEEESSSAGAGEDETELPTAGGAGHQIDSLRVDHALNMLPDTPWLRQIYVQDQWLGKVKTALEEGVSNSSEGISDQFVIDNNDLLGQRGQNGEKQMAILLQVVPDLLALVHSQLDHAGAATTLSLPKARFHWPSIVQDTKDYVLIVRLPPPEEIPQRADRNAARKYPNEQTQSTRAVPDRH